MGRDEKPEHVPKNGSLPAGDGQQGRFVQQRYLRLESLDLAFNRALERMYDPVANPHAPGSPAAGRFARARAVDRWLLSLGTLSGLRASEMVEHTTDAFVQLRTPGKGSGSDRTPDVSRWWIHVVGKGSKHRKIPASDRLIEELKLYRTAMGLPPMPNGDQWPLVVNSKGQAITYNGIHAKLKALFLAAAAEAEAMNLPPETGIEPGIGFDALASPHLRNVPDQLRIERQ